MPLGLLITRAMVSRAWIPIALSGYTPRLFSRARRIIAVSSLQSNYAVNSWRRLFSKFIITIHSSSTAQENFELKNALEVKVANVYQPSHSGLVFVHPMIAHADCQFNEHAND